MNWFNMNAGVVWLMVVQQTDTHVVSTALRDPACSHWYLFVLMSGDVS